MRNNKVLLRSYLFVRELLLFPFLIVRRTVSGVKGPVGRILILRYDRIGDMVLSTPLFESLKKNIPGCEITVVASKVNKDIISNNPFVDKVVLYQGIVKFMRDFRHRGIDLTIDPFCSYELKPALLAFLSGAKYRVGFSDAGREVFFNVKGPRPDPARHMSEQLLSLLAPLAIKEDRAQPKIYLTPEEIENAKEYFIANNYAQDCLKIAVMPGAYYPSQRWPLERFGELVKKICEKTTARVLVFIDTKEGSAFCPGWI
jgi:ADP-heptose:LPS heptosyltransferase